MKKLILLMMLAMSMTVAFGQSVSPLQIGIKAGANITNISGQSFNNGYNLNYLLGGYMTLNFSKSIGLQPELEFSQLTSTTNSNFSAIYENFGPSITNNPHLDYMSIPVLLNFGGSVLKFQLGPQFSILMNNGESFWTNGRQAFTNGDVGMDGGLWLNLPLHLNAFARYILGITNINNVNSSDPWRTQQVQLGLGLRL